MKPLTARMNLPAHADFQHGHTAVCDFAGKRICHIEGSENADKDQARAIVEAINAHAALVKALKEIAELSSGVIRDDPDYPREIARKALATVGF